MRTVTLADGHAIPQLGLGTWRLGEAKSDRSAEAATVRRALQLGYRLIDTAEMYGDGGAEEVVGAAVKAAMAAGELRREELFIVTKVLPSNASRRGVVQACARSLQRLGLDFIDLYLLHWRGAIPLGETVAALEALLGQGRIRRWGVSNFDVSDLRELWAGAAGRHCCANQVYYSASERGIEFDLLPWQREHGLVTMAYCPIDQGALAADSTFAAVGRRYGVTAATAALAWVLRQPDVVAIPKAAKEQHLVENLAAAELVLDSEDIMRIDAAFPPPRRKRRLAMT